MRRRLMIISTVLAVLMAAASGCWWVWREWYSADQLQAAIEANDTEKVHKLFGWGAKVEVRNEDSNTPLHWAARQGDLDVARLLLANGAEVDARDIYHWTPLHRAAYYKNPIMAKLLLDKGAEVDAKDFYSGQTPLHKAAFGYISDSPVLAELLLANGAKVGATDNEQRTPLDIAIKYGHTKIADLLKAHMAKQKSPAPAKAP